MVFAGEPTECRAPSEGLEMLWRRGCFLWEHLDVLCSGTEGRIGRLVGV